MSTPILPFAMWASGTNQNSIPANDNSLRNQILNGLVIGVENTPPTSADGDIYIVGAAPAGAFAGFDEHDLVIYDSGAWYAFAPVEGVCVNIAGALNQWDGSAYVAVTTGGGGSSFPPVVTESGSSRAMAPSDAGTYIRFTGTGAKTCTFDDGDGFAADEEYHIANRAASGNLTLTEAGTMTLNPPKGGTLVLEPGDTVTVKMVNTDESDVFGSTEDAP